MPGLIRERYAYDPTAYAVIGSALQSEFTSTWERQSWPDDNTPARIGACQMGVFEIIDSDTRTVRQVPVVVDLPAGALRGLALLLRS